MAWDAIENKKPASTSTTVPADGVAVGSRKLKIIRGGKEKGVTRFIKIRVGDKLAKQLSLLGEQIGVRILFGTDTDAGKIGISVDATTGNFVAKREAKGSYSITINQASAEQRFALEFPTFTVSNVEAVRPQNGQPPRAIFKASKEMLAVED